MKRNRSRDPSAIQRLKNMQNRYQHFVLLFTIFLPSPVAVALVAVVVELNVDKSDGIPPVVPGKKVYYKNKPQNNL